ncbi:MAG: glycosyltransferase family 4 protein [Pseudomonadota bacterium]
MTTILQIVPQMKPGGVEFYTLRMVDAVVKAGGRALVASAPGELVSEIDALGGEHVHVSADAKNWLRWPGIARQLSDLIAREAVDLVHVGSRGPGWLALLARRHRAFPLVMNYHGAYSTGFPGKTLYNRVMTRGDVCLASSRFTAQIVREQHGLADDKLVRIWLGIDPADFDPADIDDTRRRALLDTWGIRDGQRIVLSAGRLVSLKGHDVVIRAADHVLRAHDDAVFVIAGDDSGRDQYRTKLEEMAAASYDPSRVRLVGHCADMAAAFATAHVSVIGSIRPETFSYVAVESQAMGCPVISADAGAVGDTIETDDEAGRTGWLYPPGDADAMAKRINAALTMSPEDRAAMGARCRSRTLDLFTLERMQRETLAQYDRLLGTQLAARFSDRHHA